MDEKELEEDATQVSMVDGGKIDTFGTKPKKTHEQIMKELFELNDYEV